MQFTYHSASGFDKINMTGLYLGMTDRIRQLSEARLRQGAKIDFLKEGVFLSDWWEIDFSGFENWC